MSDENEKLSPLKCVVLCEGTTFPAWQAECLRSAVESGHMQIVGLVERVPDAAPGKKAKWIKRWRQRKLAVWRIFERLFVKKQSRAVTPVDLSQLLFGIPRISDEPIKVGRFGEKLGDEALAFVRRVQPDIIVRFAYGILKGEVLTQSRYGVWSFHHGNPEFFRGQPPGFWEMYHSAKSCGAILQVLSEELDAGRILHRGNFQIARQSYARTRDALYWGTVPWLARVCADVRSNGWEYVRGRHASANSDGPIFRQPSNLQTSKFIWKLLCARLRAQFVYRLNRQQWNCAVIEKPIWEVAGLSGVSVQTGALRMAKWMNPKRDEFFADPFGTELGDGQTRIYFERYLWTESKGVIASVLFDGEGFGTVQNEIETDTHQSYPFVFSEPERPVLVPEQSASGTLQSYLINDDSISAGMVMKSDRYDLLDTTIFRHGDKIWAFALREDWTQNTELHLYMADDVFGPWQPHPLNPVKSDIASARPAGTPFMHEKRLYRPGQDCASHYGSAVSINEITTLTETDYREHEVTRLEPLSDGPYPYGLHTLSAVGECTLIDGAKLQLKLPLNSKNQ